MQIVIEGMRLTPLQEVVVRLTEEFDSNKESRNNVLRYGLSRSGAWGYSDAELAEKGQSFMEFGSAVILRELTRAYLSYLNYLIGMIRGETTRTRLLLPDNLHGTLLLEELRSEWLGSIEFRDRVLALQQALQETFYWFNLQFVNNLTREVVSHFRGRSEDLPKAFRGLDLTHAREELQQFEDFVYCRGRACHQGQCGEQFRRLESFDQAPKHLLKLFLLSREQLSLMASYLRGNPRVTAKDITDLDPPTPAAEQKPAWKTTRGGVLIPNS